MKYIRYKNKKYLGTNDNWKTVQYLDRISDADIEEKNEDNVYVAKLKYELKDPRASFILTELEKIKNSYKKYCRNVVSYGDALEVFAIAVIHNMTYDECLANNIVIGGLDGKVDAIFFGKEKNIVYQIKTTIIGDDDLVIAKRHINQFIDEGKITDVINEVETGQNNKDLLSFCQSHSKELSEKPTEYWSISTNRTRNNYTAFDIYNLFFSHALNYGPRPDSNLSLKFKRKYRLNEEGKDESNYANIGNDFFMFVDAIELIKQLNLNIDDKLSLEKVFGYNVRKYMGKDEELQNTIDKDAQKFVLYNNGISIIGSVDPIGNHFIVKKPFFVNGQQTIMNLTDSYKDGKDISKVVLPVFVKNVSDEKDILAIAKYNNTQKPIKPIDLLSLDENVRIIQEAIFNETFCECPDECYVLNIYSSGKKDNVTLKNKLIRSCNQVSLIDFLRLYSCVDKPSNMGEWKNGPTKLIKDEYKVTSPFDVNKALNVCKSIAIRKKMSASNSIFTYSSVAVEYLLYKSNFNETLTRNVINEYVDEHYNLLENKPKNIADIFKTPKTYERLKTILDEKHNINY